MNRTALMTTSASGERIDTVQDIKNPMPTTTTITTTNEGGRNQSNDAKSDSVAETFPWVSEFKRMCICTCTEKTMASFAELMQYYIRNINVTVSNCYTKPLKAAKLKHLISETLPLFLYLYRELSENCNRSIYLNNMSDVLAMYIDMELKASKRSKEDHSLICTRLTSYLYVYLEHSTEHLLDTLLKVQLMCRIYHRILEPIIIKVIKTIPTHPDSNDMYVRYLLIYCLWRKVNSDMAVKSQITTTAIASLGAPPAAFPPSILEDVLPKVPKCQPNSAKYLMHQKFDIRKCCELFIQFCKERRADVKQEKSEDATSIPGSSKKTTSQLELSRDNENINCIENNFNLKKNLNPSINEKSIPSNNMQNNSVSLDLAEEQANTKPLGSISTNTSVSDTSSKLIKPIKKLPSRKKNKKSNKIVVIDLTSDTVREKCIKRRKSRKLPWLEEVKKLDAKAIRASQKIKKQQMAEDISLKKKIIFERLSDFLPHVTEDTHLKDNLDIFATWDTKLDNDLIVKSEQNPETECKSALANGHTVFAKQSTNAYNSDKRITEIPCTVSSVIVDKLQSNKPKATDSLSNLSKDANHVSKHNDANHISKHNDALDVKNAEKTIDRYNGQTVIKRLREKDTPPESETRKTVESLSKICDLGTEHSKTVNNSPARMRIPDDSKDGDDNCIHNGNYLSTTKDKLSPHITSSLMHAHHGSNNKHKTVNGRIENIHEKRTRKDVRKAINNGTQKRLKSTRINGNVNKGEFGLCATAEIRTTTVTSNAALNDAIESERLQRSYITTGDMKLEKPESQDEYVSARHDIANNTISLSITNGDHSNVQTDLEIGTCIEISDDVKDSEISNGKIRETIFENYTNDKKSIFNAVNVSLCSKEEEEEEEKGVNGEKNINSTKTDHKEGAGIESNQTEEERDAGELAKSSVACTKLEKSLHDLDQAHNYETSRESCKMSCTKNLQDPSGNKCIIQDSELQDNIDGLSLLAVVSQRYSQHVSNMKTDDESKYEHIKVKDYASLRSSPCNQTINDDINGSSNTASRSLESPTTDDVINRIVGIYPEDALDKVALHVEVTSTTDATPDSSENDPSNNVPHLVETINYAADALSNNLSMVENNVQSVKENTNVILNGETVVLLQKSPNSNLYIINKAVENLREHNSDDESCSVKEKSWVAPPEDCASFEVVNMSTEHISFNLDVPQYNKELSCQENKFSVGRSKGIKVEPEEEDGLMNVAEMKSYGKKGSLSVDALPATSQIYQDTNVASVNTSKSADKRNCPYMSNEFKHDFNTHIPTACVQECTIHSHEVIEPLRIPVTHPTTMSSIYGNCAASTDLYMPYRKHNCASVSCSFEINSTTSLHSHTKSANSYGNSHCSCLNCTYMFTRYRQCMHPTTDSHVSCIESNSYFLPAHSSVQTSAVQEHDRTKSDAVISKLYDDELLCKISLENNTLEKLNAQCEPEKIFKKDIDKLPLKKRLKHHAMMSMAYEKIKAEKLDNYPGVPMMSIADIEMLDGTQKHPSQVIKSSYELSPNEENNPHSNYHFNPNPMGIRQNRRDYYKDIHISNLHHNLTTESTRNHEHQFRPSSDQSNAVCLDTCQDRAFKTPAQRRDVTITNPTSLKCVMPESMDSVCKKKKSQSSRQTRSSKRNVPKVNYCYTDVDPEWNPSGESKRKRKKASR